MGESGASHSEAGAATRVEREMGFSHAEFLRALRRTYAAEALTLGPAGAEIRTGGGRVAVRLGPESERRIASLALPVTQVSLEFHDLSAGERAAFIEHFELYFRRGGG